MEDRECRNAMQDYSPEPALLDGRVILVTGAGEGIGAAAARCFSAHGATVILLDRDVRKLEGVYDAIEASGHPQPAIYPMNLEGATPNDYAELRRVLERELGRLDGLLHNAAILEGLTPIIHYNPETWYRVMQVNLNAPFLLTRAVLELMQRSVDASIVFTTDSVGEKGQAYWGAYAVAKSGGETLMRILASELEVNTPVRVNSIDPGPVRTRLRRRVYPAIEDADWVNPETVMPLYLFLMGPDSKGVTGRILRPRAATG